MNFAELCLECALLGYVYEGRNAHEASVWGPSSFRRQHAIDLSINP